MTSEKYMCEAFTGCRGAGDYREWAEQQGYPFCEVADWTSSAGDWSFVVSRDGETWFSMFQEHGPRGYVRTVDETQPIVGSADRAIKYLTGS